MDFESLNLGVPDENTFTKVRRQYFFKTQGVEGQNALGKIYC